MKKIDAFKHGKMVEAYFQPYLDLYYEEYYEKSWVQIVSATV